MIFSRIEDTKLGWNQTNSSYLVPAILLDDTFDTLISFHGTELNTYYFSTIQIGKEPNSQYLVTPCKTIT